MCASTPQAWPELRLSLPDWVSGSLPPPETVFATDEARMAVAIALADRNVKEGTGGPFGAAVFDTVSGKLVAPGVNVVVPSHCSLAHAEMMAISVAQQVMGTHDLGGTGMPRLALVTSVAPCAMCLGAIPWSGVCEVVCGARDADARAVGFDEGAKPPDWDATLGAKGIAVRQDVLREEAAAVLRSYVEGGGTIYNGGSEA